jgi:hypothetical protein
MKDKDQIILENLYSQVLENADSLYAWMNSSGKIYSNKGEGHFSSAKRIIQTLYNTETKGMMFAQSAYEFLFEKGWMRLTYIGNQLYCHNNKVRPTPKQIKELKDLAVENNMVRVSFDDEHSDDYKILWSVHNYI